MTGKDNKWFFSGEINPELRKQFMECPRMPKMDFATFERNFLGEWRTEKDELQLTVDRVHKESVLTKIHSDIRQHMHDDALEAHVDIARELMDSRIRTHIGLDGTVTTRFAHLGDDDEKDPGVLEDLQDITRGHGGCPDDMDECMAILYGFK